MTSARTGCLLMFVLVAVVSTERQQRNKRSIESQLQHDYESILTSSGLYAEKMHSRHMAKANLLPASIKDAFSVVQALSGSNLIVKTLSYRANVIAEALKRIQQRYRLSKKEIIKIARSRKYHLYESNNAVATDTDLTNIPTPNLLECPFPKYKCGAGNDKFRTLDASCNNLGNPLFGKSNVPLNRLLSADYGNGIESLRKAISGKDLPSPREVSNKILTDRNIENTDLTNMHMIFGQFLDHDMDKVAITKMADSDNKLKDLQCGSGGCSIPEDEEACAPIKVAIEDTVFGGKKECVKFVRSEGSPDIHCTLGARQQANQITAFLDASLVYGNDKKDAGQLRNEMNSRFLKFFEHPFDSSKKYLLPQADIPACRDLTDVIKCFKAGDGRVNENVGLSAVHTIFTREHNRIVKELKRINSHWDDETLYQETRRIIGAVMSEITYKEYNPIVLGEKFIASFGLRPSNGYYHGYDPRIDAGVSTEFATAAFRFGHSQIPATMTRVDKHYNLIDDMVLSKLMRRPAVLYDTHGVDAILLGMIEQKVLKTDAHFTIEVSSRLFAEMPPKGLGLDLPAMNTQRGRDHGIAGYNAYRELCGSGRAWSFEDLYWDISYENILKLKTIYDHVDDIDLFVGGILERHVSGGVVGPVFACIIAKQFSNTRKGDRYWYENAPGKSPNPFTKDQLAEIRKVTLARIMCDNGDDVLTIQPRVMETPGRRFSRPSNYFARYGRDNSRVPCSKIPSMNLGKWEDAHKAPPVYDRRHVAPRQKVYQRVHYPGGGWHVGRLFNQGAYRRQYQQQHGFVNYWQRLY